MFNLITAIMPGLFNLKCCGKPIMSAVLIEKIRRSVIGDKYPIRTSFGEKPLVYADYTASGRALSFIEDYIRHQVLPFYANTHTETSFTGFQSTQLREQARATIARAVNAGAQDKIIFCGSGATAAINKLIDILNIRLPADLSDQHNLMARIPAQQRPVVFIGPYEHHSNELPWRESIADVEEITMLANGHIDIDMLRQKLRQYSDRKLKIGSFSAASNVTGIKTDVDQISALLHEHDAVAFWDYAAAAPYVTIDMQSEQAAGDCHKDAIFISPHKFIGGPGTPGVLVVNNSLLTNRVPAMPGGGTVVYVTPQDHKYKDDPEQREEGGTPAIIESIRAGLVFKLQQDVGTETIESREASFIQRALERWQQHPNIEVLGNPKADRLSIVSLRIKHQDKDLHYGFVVALLNDLFGIQARGGCSCAGPYGHTLLGMDANYSKALEKELFKGHIVLRPGWVRLNFNYFIDEETFEYLLRAVELIADYGINKLPFYCFDSDSGTWRYQNNRMTTVNDIEQLDFARALKLREPTTVSQPLSFYLAEAIKELTTNDPSDTPYTMHLPDSAEKLRWFVLPQEVHN